MKCPICITRRATSTHHMKSRDNNGSDNHKNKVMLCRPCHDKAEEIYNNTGAELSPQVVKLVRLEYGFPVGSIDDDIDRSILATSLYKMRRKYKLIKEKRAKTVIQGGVSIRCPRCNGWHCPEKSGVVRCSVPKAVTTPIEEIDATYNMLMDKIKKIRISIE